MNKELKELKEIKKLSLDLLKDIDNEFDNEGELFNKYYGELFSKYHNYFENFINLIEKLENKIK